MIRSLLLIFFCLVQQEVLVAQDNKSVSHSKEQFIMSASVDGSHLYFVCRGTKAKSKIIAEQFNLVDDKATHVGIGYLDHDKKMLVIAHMSNEKDADGYNLRTETLPEFLSGEEVYYASVWAVTASKTILNAVVENICLQMQKRNRLYFDEHFDLQTNNFLYCSEFCVKLLPVGLQKRWKIKATTKLLNNSLLEIILGRSKIRYYPVDFFRSIKRCRLISIWASQELR